MHGSLSFGHWLKQRRKALDLTQQELARLVGCAVVTSQKFEEGQRRPSKQVAERLAEQLTIPVEERGSFLHLARAGESPDQPTPPPSHSDTATNLSTPLTPLFGRIADATAVRETLTRDDVRLLTLVGPPGVGKTRLSVQVAGELCDRFPDGVWFVALAPIRESHLVAPSIAHTLGLAEAGTQPPLEQLKTVLRAKHTLLVLDNFEQIVVAAPLVTELLAVCRQLKVLATSRTPLHVYGEHEFAVEPLAVPARASNVRLAELMDYAAVQLFVARVRAFQPDFALTAEHGPAIAEICRRLDGLPLAIELAAARMRQFTPESFVAHLNRAGDNPFPLLSAGPRDLPARQQTLHNALTWSYALLNGPAQQLFRRMGVFVGGCTVAAAVAVCGSTDSAHAAYFLEQAEDVQNEAIWLDPMAVTRWAGLDAWLDRMEADHDNLRAALRWSRAHAAATGLRLCRALWWLWEAHGHWSEARRWIEAMLAAAPDASPHLRMENLACAGALAWQRGDYAQVTAVMSECLVLSRTLGAASTTAYVLMILGQAALEQGDYPHAASLLNESLALKRGLGDPASGPLMHLGQLALAQEDYSQAQQLGVECLEACKQAGDTFYPSLALRVLGETVLAQGDHKRACTLLKESVARSRDIRHRRAIAFALVAFAGAVTSGREPLADDVRATARIWGAAEALREEVGIFLPVAESTRYERAVAHARAWLPPDEWVAAWAEGRAMALEQAIAFALSLQE